MGRKLASVQHVHDVWPIEGADNVAMQGEFCGAGIQRNPLKLQRPGWFVFTVRDVAAGRRYGLWEMRDFCKRIGLKTVPVEEEDDSFSYGRARGEPYRAATILPQT